jgi:predicted PurR-regulated permease PerM
MLKPIVDFFEARIKSRIFSILTAYLVAALPFFALVIFFFNQSKSLFRGLPSVKDKFESIISGSLDYLNGVLQLEPQKSSDLFSDNFGSVLDVPIGYLQNGFESGTSLLAYITLIILITYFMLLYSTSFKNFIISQIYPDHRERLKHLLSQIQHLTVRYMMGQGVIVVILGLLIGTGLWIIGVPHPFFWGFLAGFLEIIPYVGTTIGVVLPFSYMLLVSESLWQPWAVIVLYILIQQIEGNIISPLIMGPSIKINPLFIIMGLFLGAFMWGISGMILALPILAVFKEIFRAFDALVPLSFLMENGLSKKASIFLDEFDSPKHRFLSLFFNEKSEGYKK